MGGVRLWLNTSSSGASPVQTRALRWSASTRISASNCRFRREVIDNAATDQIVMANLWLVFISLHAVALERQCRLLVIVGVQGLPLRRRWYLAQPGMQPPNDPVQPVRGFIAERGAGGGESLPGAAARWRLDCYEHRAGARYRASSGSDEGPCISTRRTVGSAYSPSGSVFDLTLFSFQNKDLRHWYVICVRRLCIGCFVATTPRSPAATPIVDAA